IRAIVEQDAKELVVVLPKPVEAALDGVSSHGTAKRGLSPNIAGSPVISNSIREIEIGAVVVSGIEVIEGRDGQDPVVRKGPNPREVQRSVTRPLAVDLDHAVSYIGCVHRPLVEISA